MLAIYGLQELFPLLFSNDSFLASGSFLACMFISTSWRLQGDSCSSLEVSSLWAAFFPPVLCPWNFSHFGLPQLTIVSSQGNCMAVRWDSRRAQLVSSAMRDDYPVVLIFFFSLSFFFSGGRDISIPCYSILATCKNKHLSFSLKKKIPKKRSRSLCIINKFEINLFLL